MAERANMPLAGITVLDFGQVYQGPYATLLMATAGADVIKIEPPNGEPLRRRAPPGKSTTFPIAMLNSNKRAITLNLKDERGKRLLFRMAEKADVLLENFAPGVMDRLGVGFKVLHAINPGLVYASTMTALYERSVTGAGRLVEVAMEEAAYPTMTSQLEAYWRSGKTPERT